MNLWNGWLTRMEKAGGDKDDSRSSRVLNTFGQPSSKDLLLLPQQRLEKGQQCLKSWMAQKPVLAQAMSVAQPACPHHLLLALHLEHPTAIAPAASAAFMSPEASTAIAPAASAAASAAFCFNSLCFLKIADCRKLLGFCLAFPLALGLALAFGVSPKGLSTVVFFLLAYLFFASAP